MSRKILYLPIKVLSIYLFVLFIVSIIGPVKYNYNPFYCFVELLFLIAFILFTRFGMDQSIKRNNRIFCVNNKHSLFVYKKIITISILIMLPVKILLLISTIQMLGFPELSNVFKMLANVYSDMHSASDYNIFRQVDTFLTFLFYISTFSTFYLWKEIKLPYRLLAIVNVLLDLLYNLFFIGTLRSLFTIILLFLLILIIKSVSDGKKVNKSKIFKLIVLLIVAFVIVSNALAARKELWAGGNSDYIYGNKNYDFSNFLLFWCWTDNLKYNVCNVISYLTQGFYNFSLALQVPFEWTFFLGSVRGLNSIISQIFPFIQDMTPLTYPVRAGIEFGRDGLANWYTIFPWIASDFTWVGCLIYFSFVGYLFMNCWIQTIKYKNPLSFCLLVLLFIQYVFLVANNQLFISRGESLGTIIILAIYFIFSKKTNRFERLKYEI